jgi:hypothetical protein
MRSQHSSCCRPMQELFRCHAQLDHGIMRSAFLSLFFAATCFSPNAFRSDLGCALNVSAFTYSSGIHASYNEDTIVENLL